MIQATEERRWLIERLRRSLPLSVHPKPPLLANLRRIAPNAVGASLILTNVYDAGEAFGVMCQLDISRYSSDAPHLIVSIRHLALDRRHPIAREVAAYRKRRATNASAVNC